MKRLISFIIIALLVVPVFGQSILTDKLQDRLTEKGVELIPIRIELEDKIDCFAMNLEFKQDEVPVQERPRLVIESLVTKSDETQAPVKDFIRSDFPKDYANMKSFWIANIMVLEASEELIYALEHVEGIAQIDLEDNRFVPYDKPDVVEGDFEKEEGGIEPGLEAINAPAMWALGYTGRGQVVYNYDTGVWPMHPAYSDRFMGNFYPVAQSWYGYHFEYPSGHINGHGTHTLGTIGGLVEETNDTIGVAFKSYWLANDYVEETVPELLPITEMITAFEWALNPDGDIETSHDVPSVISNSWRWYDEEDDLHCEEGFVVDIMNAIEAAGIANVFAGGNFGPNNTHVNSPQRINTSEVNTFSVGSVNATNFNFPYPISSFSSRGPTQCPGEGALEIHPEVVAPGQNVRSAYGHNEFEVLSGTSMATPHVSGALLLLKEAFPYLSGEELLWAVYLTAIDLGEEGEDNVFGNGLIDVFAAYEYLAEENIPVDPNAVEWDLELSEVQGVSTGLFTCENSYSPTLVFTNQGMNTIEEFQLDFRINGGDWESAIYSDPIVAGESTELNINSLIADDYGDVELEFVSSITGVDNEYDLYNNRRIIRFNYRSSNDLPFQEGFESGFAHKDWYRDNVDYWTTWDTIPTDGLEGSTYSASMQYFTYNPREEQIDGLVSPELFLPDGGGITLKFHRSYPKAQSNANYRDTLRVKVSTNCGEDWETVFEKYSFELSTMDTLVGDFIPEYDTHWKRDSVDLSPFSGEAVLIQFEGVNKRGNNLYLDNIMIYQGETEPVGIDEQEALNFAMSPNPAHHFVEVNLPAWNGKPLTIELFDVQGRAVYRELITTDQRFVLELDPFRAGVYTLSISSDKVRSTKRLVKY